MLVRMYIYYYAHTYFPQIFLISRPVKVTLKNCESKDNGQFNAKQLWKKMHEELALL